MRGVRSVPECARAFGSRRTFTMLATVVMSSTTVMDDQGCRRGDLGDRVVLQVTPVEDELHPDESEDDRQAGREVDQPVEQAGDEEVQRAVREVRMRWPRRR